MGILLRSDMKYDLSEFLAQNTPFETPLGYQGDL